MENGFVEDRCRVGVVHAGPVYFDLAASIDRAARWVEEAGHEGTDVLVFPESFLPGFPYFINLVPPPEFGELYVDLVTNCVPAAAIGETLAPVMAAAAQSDCMVIIGIQEFDGGTIYNSLAFIDEAGSLALVRRKLVPTGAERTVWGYGDGSTLQTVGTRHGVTVSGMMCWEHMMPLARHVLADANPRIHAAVWPGLRGIEGFSNGYDRQVDLLAGSFALSAQTFVASAMNPINQDVVDFTRARLPGLSANRFGAAGACSTIYSPSGHVVEQYSGDVEQILLAEVDLFACLRMKRVVDGGGHFARKEVFELNVDRTPYSFRTT